MKYERSNRHTGHSESHLVQVRGLKLWDALPTSSRHTIAPRAGAWIEMLDDSIDNKVLVIAPRAGAWIEID